MDQDVLKDLARATKALLLIQLQADAVPEKREKPEVLLGRAGFNAREVAELLGKKQGAVAKAIQRAARAG